MPETLVDTAQDDEQDKRPDPVSIFMRAAGQSGDDQGDDWGELFTKAANGARVRQAPTDTNAGRKGGDDETFRTGEPTKSGPLPQPMAPEPGPSRDTALSSNWSDFVGPTQPPAESTSDAARSLGEFAAASGTSAQPPAPQPTHLSQVPGAQPPPPMPPEYAGTQEGLRAHSAVTPKYGPDGKILPQYKPSVMSRIGRGFLDAAEGFIGGGPLGAAGRVLGGAFGDKNAPGYFGKDAVSGQYRKDEQARQNAVAADTAKIKSFADQQKEAQQNWTDTENVRKDTMRQAYEQDTAEQRAKYQQDTTDLKQQAEDLKEQLRSIDYDPRSGNFMRGGNLYTPKDFQEGAVLEVQHGLTTFDANGKAIKKGPMTIEWEKERRNQPITVHAGGDKGFTARDLVRIKSYAKDHNIKLKSTSPEDIADSMTQQQVDEALSAKYIDQGDSILRGDALRNFKADTEVQNIDAEMKKLDSDRSLYTQGLGSDDPNLKRQSQESLKGIDQRIADLTARRNAKRDQYVEMQNKREQRPAPATPTPKTAPPVQMSGKPNPPAATKPKLTPIHDKSMKTPSGKVYNIDDVVPGRGKIKSFSKGDDGKTYANF
jgi:hypothetical protein